MKKGFTLIELVIYVGILSILVSVMGAIFASILDVQLESEASASVDQDGRYVLSRLSYDLKNINPGGTSVTDNIDIPAHPGDVSNTLQIHANSISYTYSLDSNNNLTERNNTLGETNVLNSIGSSVSGLSFMRIGAGDKNDTIRVNFTVTSRTRQTKGYESKAFQTSIARQ